MNHSRLNPNCITKVIQVEKSEQPRLVLIAKCDIDAGTELLFDYGDKSKESLAAHPWLAKWAKSSSFFKKHVGHTLSSGSGPTIT